MPTLPPPPPPPKSSGKRKGDDFQQWVNTYAKRFPGLRKWAADIRWTAKLYGLDPIYLGAVMLIESGANAKVRDSSAGAIGLMQIMPLHEGEATPWAPDHKITEADLRNPEFNLRWGAYYLSQQVNKYGYAQAYSKGYNPGYRGPGPWQYVPKSHSSLGTGGAAGPGASPEGAAQRSVEESAAKAQLLRGAAFLQEKLRIDTIYEAYTGRRATNAQARVVIQKGWSDYHLELLLSKGPRFAGSPVWKAHAPSYLSVIQGVYGQNAKLKNQQQLIAYAIIHNLDGAGFSALLRQRKDYIKSSEFKTNAAGLEAVYRKIYGAPSQAGIATIQRATLAGWSTDQFAKYLRSQPEYSQSQEFGSGVMGLLQTLGGVTGQGVILTPGTPEPYQSPGGAVAAPKADKRVQKPAGVGVQGAPYEVTLTNA